MPLSDHEQRQLEQIEQSLHAQYPKLAQAVRAKDPRVHYRRRVVLAMIGFLLGVGLLMTGVLFRIIFISAGGFAVMLGSAMWALSSWRHMGGILSGRGIGVVRPPGMARGPGTARGGPGTARGPRRRSLRGRRNRVARQGFMERLEERWRRRQEGQR